MQTYLLPANNLYGNCPVEITIPDSWEMTVCSFAGEHSPSLTFEEIAAKINTPSGVPPIHEQAKGCRDAVIILDDITRATPIGSIARAVIHELEEAGMPRNKIRFLAAVGTHRAMYREDFVRKLDEELVSEFPTYSHNPFFNNVYLGKTSYGIPIELNADAVAADFKVAIGSIAPHGAVGLAGGAKTILPGIASIETIRRSHLLQRGRWNKEAPGRQNALEATHIFKLNMKIDALLNGKGDIAQIFAGDPGQIIDDNYEEIKAFYKTPKASPIFSEAGASTDCLASCMIMTIPFLSIYNAILPFLHTQIKVMAVHGTAVVPKCAGYSTGTRSWKNWEMDPFL